MASRPNGDENPPGQRYCSECGQPLARAERRMARRPNGDENPDGQRYCSECGQPLVEAAGQGTQAPHSEAGETGSPAAVQPLRVSSQEAARALGVPNPAGGRAAAATTVPLPRSGPPASPPPGTARPPSQPPAKPWYRKPRILVPIIIVAVVVALAAVGVGALLGGRSKSGATTQSQSSTQSPASNKKQSSVTKWVDKNGSNIQGLSKSIQATVAADSAGPNTSGLRSACQGLGDASRAAAGALPAPNANLTNALRGAIDDSGKAAQECITGVDSSDPAAHDQFRSDLAASQHQIGEVAYIVQAFNKRG
jgi:FlaG/FlaF family flagellin (archaellin)